MARRPSLAVWLYGVQIATLTEPATYRYRLAFTPAAIATFGVGARVLSLALPISDEPATDHPTDATRRPVAAFLEGLLPEGQLRASIAATLGVATIDKMALLAQVGAECAGAVQFLPEEQPRGAGHIRLLEQQEVDRIVADLPTYHLPEGAAPQASLAGIQDKVLLTLTESGQWGWPEEGAASTHLIKPEPLGPQPLSHLIESEHWALRVAAEANIPAAHASLQRFDGRLALVVERYDRLALGQRVHQEDFCQALSLDPHAKYETLNEADLRGSRLSRLARLAADRSEDPDAFRRQLLTQVTFNVGIANADAHSKNYSLLIGPRGDVGLAPLYDCAPVMLLSRSFNSTGHVINGRTRIDYVDSDDLVAEAAKWGMSERRARETVTDVFARIWRAVHEVAPPTADALPRLTHLWERRGWPRTASR